MVMLVISKGFPQAGHGRIFLALRVARSLCSVSSAPKELQPGDKVYVAGFGWVEYEGPNHCEDGADIYENGNKIGIMG